MSISPDLKNKQGAIIVNRNSSLYAAGFSFCGAAYGLDTQISCLCMWGLKAYPVEVSVSFGQRWGCLGIFSSRYAKTMPLAARLRTVE
jgi:hypothetical protein